VNRLAKLRVLASHPIFMRRANGWLAVKWALHFPVIIYLYFFQNDVWESASILYLALVSIYANVAGHWAGWQAARVEVKQFEDADVQEVLDELRQRAPSED